MATGNSDIYAKQADPKMGNRVAASLVSAAVLFATAKYTMTGSEAAADIINIVKLPQGTTIIPGLCSVTGDGIATTATLDVGDDDDSDAADADRYADGLDVAASGTDLFTGIAGVAQQTPYTLGKDAIIQGTFATMATPVADKVLTFRIAYLAVV